MAIPYLLYMIWHLTCFFLISTDLLNAYLKYNSFLRLLWLSSSLWRNSRTGRAPSGIITSPGWPSEYPARINCSWFIRANPGGNHYYKVILIPPCIIVWYFITKYKSTFKYHHSTCSSIKRWFLDNKLYLSLPSWGEK